MKSNIKSNKGFTIIELLVVIVVIGILAAITIVSYSGISNRAKTAANQSNAQAVQTTVEAVFAEKSYSTYPVWTTDSATTLGLINAGIAKVPSSIVLQNSAATAGTNIGYVTVSSNTGVCISYWDYSGTGAAHYLGAGAATVNSTGTSCS